MTDADLRKLEREWDSSRAPRDGIAFYDALARRGPLPCPHCGGSESLSDLLRMECERVPEGVDPAGWAVQQRGHEAIAFGRGVSCKQAHETNLGNLGSIETCARCGTVWNRDAAGRAADILRGSGSHNERRSEVLTIPGPSNGPRALENRPRRERIYDDDHDAQQAGAP